MGLTDVSIDDIIVYHQTHRENNMVYQLVLITNLGIITPLAVFPNFEQCIVEKAKISKTGQYSAECLPTNDPKQLQRSSQESTKLMMDALQKLTKEQK